MQKPVYRNERILFSLAAVISIVLWLGIGWVTKGMALIVLPVFFLVYLFAQSGFICYLKGQGALVSVAQYPDIQERVSACAEKTGLKITPSVYIMNGNGLLNAFATGFLRRKYIVLFSDVLDALEDKADAINFYIGHEMGHIDRKHLLYQSILAPALCLPLLGAAYSRAREYTCDMYGALCCPPEAAQQGLSLLAVGGKRYKTLDVQEYLGQMRETSGFWMSFHELIGSYPWLVKRYARVSPGITAENIPSRSIFAYLFALFVPRFNIVSLVVVYFLILGMMMKGAMPGMDFMRALDQQQAGQQQDSSPEAAPAYEVGKTYDGADGKKLRYLGGDPDAESSWQEAK